MNRKQSLDHTNVNVDLMEKKHNTDQWWNNDKAWCECKKRDACEKDNIWKDNILHVIVKMENI